MPERRHEVTRLEGFSDAVFGFALTLLVVSLDVPSQSDELFDLMKGLPSFALSFAMVCWIWHEHNKFFRRYGLQDAWTTFLNAVLLFIVLVYVYPLKYLTSAVVHAFTGFGPHDGPTFDAGSGSLMLLYSLGVIALFGTFVLLYLHARSRKAALNLSPADEVSLKFGIRSHAISMSLGFLSIVLLYTVHPAVGGFSYALMGPLHAWNGYQAGKAHATLSAAGTARA